MNNKYILISGNICSGKTTLSQIINKELGFEVYYEPYYKNPYLDRFYIDMKEWAYKSQLYFLAYHLKQHLEISSIHDKNIVKDCSIYESVEVFGKNMYLNGDINEEDWETYYSLYTQIIKTIRIPDLIIKLNCPAEIIMKRIAKRGREMEQNISRDYIEQMDKLYKAWVYKVDDTKIIEIDSFNNSLSDEKRVGETIKELLISS